MKGIIILLTVTLLVACAPIQVNYDYDKEANFNEYTTYNYASGIKMDIGDFDQKRLITQLDSTMQSKGFSKTESPSFYIDLHSRTVRSQSRNSIGIGVGSGGGNVGVGVGGGIPIGGNELNQDIEINFLKGTDHSLFWQAKVSASIKEKASPESKKAYYKKIVVKVLEGFPPQSKK